MEIQSRLRAHLEPYDGRLIVDGIAASVLGSVREYLGALDLSLDGDSSRIERAVVDYQQMGALLLEGRARSRLSGIQSVGAGPPVAAPSVARPSVALEGDVWRFGFDGSTCTVRDGKGVRDLVRLLERPEVELHVSDLAGPGVVSSSAPPVVLDAAAKRAYRERVSSLRSDIDEAEAAHDGERAARARVELDFLLDELRLASGLGGRDRTLGSDHERARQAVRARIRHAIDRIAAHHPALGRHLERSIRTGTFCAYSPDAPTSWVVSR